MKKPVNFGPDEHSIIIEGKKAGIQKLEKEHIEDEGEDTNRENKPSASEQAKEEQDEEEK